MVFLVLRGEKYEADAASQKTLALDAPVLPCSETFSFALLTKSILKRYWSCLFLCRTNLLIRGPLRLNARPGARDH